MNVIEAETELFDLFGETGTCTICCEDLQDGERVRAIRKCQHLFHTTCIDPWLLRKAECPMCRAQLGSQSVGPVNISRVATASNTIRDLLNATNGYSANSITSLNNLLNTIETLIGNQGTGDAATLQPLQRYVIAFCLADGILRRHTSALSFNQVRLSIRETVESYVCQGVRSMPLDLSNRTSLQRSANSYRAEILRRLNVGSRVHIYNQEAVATVYNLMRQSAVLASIWNAN